MATNSETHDMHAPGIESGWLSPSIGSVSEPPRGIEGQRPPHAGFGILGLEPRRTVFCQGEAVTSVFEILEGAIMLTSCLPDGRRQVLEILGPGQLIGVPLGKVHRTGAVTIRETLLKRFDRAQFEASQDLEERVRKELDQRFARLQDMVVMLGCKTASERVAAFLLQLAGGRPGEKVSREPPRPLEIELDLGQSEIAAYLGITLETVCREFTKLKRLGILCAKSRTRLVIADIRRLADAAQESRPPRVPAPRARKPNGEAAARPLMLLDSAE